MKSTIWVILFCTACFAYSAPQRAIDACESLSKGQSCSIITPRNVNLTGVCRQPQKSDDLICVPNRRNERLSGSIPQEQGSRRLRQHTINQSDGVINTLIADVSPITDSVIDIEIEGDQRILKANGISQHDTGAFPNSSNPNPISEQNYEFRVPAFPQKSEKITPLGLHDFGLGVNGVPFDPGAAEWYMGDRRSGWQYEAMSGAISLGLDENHAHVQGTGAYHYHGLPSFLIEDLNVNKEAHSPLVGWAADGFPIYALYGYESGEDTKSGIVELQSSYRLKEGHRPSGGNNPGGHYDGTFLADYEYVAGSGDLDECNGRFTVTTEFPNGTYAYFLTDSFPIIPRCYKGIPSTDFTQQRVR